MLSYLKIFLVFSFLYSVSVEARFLYWESSIGFTKNKWSESTYNLSTPDSDIGTDLGGAFFVGLADQGAYPNHHFGLGLRHRSLNFENETIKLLNLRFIYRYEIHKYTFDFELSPLNEFDKSGVKDFESLQVLLSATKVFRLTQFFHISIGPSVDWILPEPNSFPELNYSLNLFFRFIPASKASSNIKYYKKPRY